MDGREPKHQPMFPSTDTVPGPERAPALYDGIMLKRVLAYVVDFTILLVLGLAGWMALAVAGLLTFGLLWGLMPIFAVLLPVCYHGFLVGGPHASTWGMRLLGLRVMSVDGLPPSLFQGFVMAGVFYVTVPFTSFLILAVALFNPRHRTLHDWLSGTVVVNRPA